MLSVFWLGGSLWASLIVIHVLWSMTLARPRLQAPGDILPSALSTLRRVRDKLSVHLLRKAPTAEAAVSGAVLCCHGFGANATSYEEVAHLLSRDLASVVLCPDQVGFGLTERPRLRLQRGVSFSTELDSLAPHAAALSAPQMYTLAGNAVLAGALLEEEEGKQPTSSTVIIGHSMGVARFYVSEEDFQQVRNMKWKSFLLVAYAARIPC